jgi:hypothetical protein
MPKKKKSRNVTRIAQRSHSKAVVEKGAAESVPPPAQDGIEPVDYAQCQAEITHGVSTHNFMKMGGQIRTTARCENTPSVMVTEMNPGKDGKKGHMSLCSDCLVAFKARFTNWRRMYTFKAIDGTMCPKNDGEEHELDAFNAVARADELVIDVYCKHCGRSGSVTINPKDVLW